MEPAPGPRNHPVIILVITVISGFLSSFAGSSVNVALPEIGKAFSLDAVTLNWIGTAFLLASAAFMIPGGRAGDIFGRKKIFLAGTILTAVSGTIAGLAQNAGVLIAARVFQGLGGALIASTSTAILISVYPPEKRGRALGFSVAAIYIGLSAGPFLGGILTHALGWRSIFFISLLFGIVVIPLVLLFIKGDWHEARGEKLDIPGTALFAVSLSLLMLGVSRLPRTTGFIMGALGLAGIILFLILEDRSDHPMLNVGLFRSNRVFAFSNLAAMISYSATFSVAFFLSLYLQSVKDMTPQDAGLVLLIQPLIQAVLSPLMGRLSDRLEPRFLASAGMGLIAAGLLVLAFLNAASALPPVITALSLLGVGFALFSSPNTNSIMGSVEKKFYGVASATVSTMRTVGQLLSMTAALLLTSIFVGKNAVNSANPAPFMMAMKTGFAVFSALSAAGILASLARGRRR